MKLDRYINGVACLCVVGLATLASCSDEWDQHYETNGRVPDVSLMDLLRQDSRLQKFCQIVEKTQEDTLLASSQTYTVWAPQNEALEGVDMNDMDALRRLVRNHIGRYTNPTSTSPDEQIHMLNNKIMSFKSASQYMEASIAEGNLVARNGVLHVMKDQIPYRPNVLERIANDPDYSKVYEFITRWTYRKYDAGLSTTYDSVYVDYNPMMSDKVYGIGHLNVEDSLYTVILPDNEAWDEAMTRLKPYFKAGAKLTGDDLKAYQDSVCESRAGQAILSGLTFSARKFQTAEGDFIEPTVYDSLFTVDRHLLYKENLQTYFNGYEREKVSNGWVYLAKGHLNMADTCTWNPTIEIEGENFGDVKSDEGVSPNVRSITSDSYVRGVSNNSYLEITPADNTHGATFQFWQVLSGKYEIWVDYLPPIVDGMTQKARGDYTFAYTTDEGTAPRTPQKTFRNTNYTLQNAVEYEFVDGLPVIDEKEGVISQKVGEIDIPIADYYDPMWRCDEKNGSTTLVTNTKLKVQTRLSSSENRDKVNWGRILRIDRVRLVPVIE